MSKSFKLCYIEKPFAYFTTKRIQDQWGDDWDDAPYEHNAGDPYTCDEKSGQPKWDIMKIAFESEMLTPCDHHLNSPFSVQEINKGAIAWLRTPEHMKMTVNAHLFAGASVSVFIDTILRTGGTVYESKNESLKKSIYDLRLHETTTIKGQPPMHVVRVAGGWMYCDSDENYGMCNVFVPYDNEFQPPNDTPF